MFDERGTNDQVGEHLTQEVTFVSVGVNREEVEVHRGGTPHFLLNY